MSMMLLRTNKHQPEENLRARTGKPGVHRLCPLTLLSFESLLLYKIQKQFNVR